MAILNKKLFLALALSACFASIVLIPAVQGYGTNATTAETISNGPVNETLSSSDMYAYFKIYCSAGDILSIALIYHAGNDLDLRLQNPSQSQVASSYNTDADEFISYVCTTSGYHYIQVFRFDGTTSATIEMSVAGATGTAPVTPGFDVGILLVVLFSATALGVVLMKKKSKVIPASG